ncbi:hypothetical protein BGZ73_004250 [Actinomortierella ambigua]|nr:hypothetical protein BGZ73_004250 [Actinomortierella ambigua]
MNSSEDVVAPGSPYMDLLSSSFSSSDRDFTLDDRFSRPTMSQHRLETYHEEDEETEEDEVQQQHAILSPRLRNKLSSINPFRSSASMSTISDRDITPTRTTSPPPQTAATTTTPSNGRLYANPFESRTPSPAPSSSSQSLKKSVLKSNHHAQHRPPPPAPTSSNPYLQQTYPTLSPSPLQPPATIPGLQQGTAFSNVSSFSYKSSSYEHEGSTQGSMSERRNLGARADPSYNLTQSDLTLEGLAERWEAYQGMMAKYYREVPFYRRWTRSKWVLIFTVVVLMAYSIAGLVFAVGFLTKQIEHSVLVLEFHSNLIYLCLAGSVIGIVTGIIGAVGVWRENRVWLSVYNLLLWIVFVLFTAIGYVAFLRAKEFLRASIQNEWNYEYTRQQRLLVQRELKCCGYNSPTSGAAYDLRCFPGTVLPGCHSKYNKFENNTLKDFWMASFALVPVELFVMLAALLCSNHVDNMWRSARPGLVSFKEDKTKWQ